MIDSPSTASLREFLEAKFRERHPEFTESGSDWHAPLIRYAEDVNPDAIIVDAHDGASWLKSNTSWIWKVGVLSVIDANKSDWAYLLIGHQRTDTRDFEFIGELHWADGENDDIGRCLPRYLDLARSISHLYQP